MNARLRFTLTILSLSVVVSLIASNYKTTARLKDHSSAQRQRRMEDHSHSDTPVRIVDVRIGQRKVSLKESFESSDPSAQEAQSRIIGTKVDVDAPLKIAAVKTKRGGIKRDEKFFADDDWLRGLTIRLTNDSGKAVSFVGLVLLFSRTEDQKPGIPAGWPFEYGLDPFESVENPMPMSQFEDVLPGSDLEIQLSDREYEEIKSF